MNNPNGKLSVKERIARAGPPTKTVRVWLGADLDLLEQYETAQREFDEAQSRPPDSLEATGAAPQAAARLAELREQLEQYAIDFRLRGMDDKRWQKLVAEHPPRQTADGSPHPDDNSVGWDKSTFPLALVRAATAEPELDDDDWRALLGDDTTEGALTAAQLDDLASEAFKLSKYPVDIPFSFAASRNPPSSAAE